MGVLVASPRPFPPPPAPVPWTGVASMTWSSGLYGEFNLIDPTVHGVMLVQDGVRGLSMPPVQRWTSTSPALDGSTWRGHRIQEREVFWPLFVWSDQGTDAWLDVDTRLWKSLRPDEVGVWEVATRDGYRSLRCRFVDDGDHSFGRDPLKTGWTLYGIRLVAESPFWEGDRILVQWDTVADEPLLPGPPFTIAGSNRMDSAVLDNPGDVAAWPVWRVWGPCATARVGLAGRVIEIPFSIADGEILEIDTSPDAQTAMLIVNDVGGDEGTDRTGDLGAAEFAPVPAGEALELSLDAAGGYVECELTPLYYRAWG